eukprot:jgi/Psemu1/8071/gm1.8071_g
MLTDLKHPMTKNAFPEGIIAHAAYKHISDMNTTTKVMQESYLDLLLDVTRIRKYIPNLWAQLITSQKDVCDEGVHQCQSFSAYIDRILFESGLIGAWYIHAKYPF